MDSNKRLNYYRLSVDEVLSELQTQPKGLSPAQAERRLQQIGSNTLVRVRPDPALVTLFKQCKNILVVLLLISAGFSFYLDDYKTAIILFLIAAINTAVGYFQGHRTETTLQSLTKLLVPQAKVWRGGREIQINSSELVPGDIVAIERGDSVPADVRLIKELELATNDFSLTGESNPSRKFTHAIGASVPLGNRHNLAFMGTTVATGSALGVVIGTGMQTELGRIASLTQSAHSDISPLQREMKLIARRITQGTALVAFAVTLITLKSDLSLENTILFAISIGAAMVPSALLAEVSITLSQTATRLARSKTLVKKLAAVETLGTTDFILTDKTGTLTKNEMTVETVLVGRTKYAVTGIGYEANGEITNQHGSALSRHQLQGLELFFATGLLASNALVNPPDEEHAHWHVVGDPTEGALITLARKAGLDTEAWEAANPEIKEFQFDSARKRLSSVRRRDGQIIVYVKGAYENIIDRSHDIWEHGHIRPLTAADRNYYDDYNQKQAHHARRNLALAYRILPKETDLHGQSMDEIEQELTFLGMVSMVDPLRDTVVKAMKAAAQAHIKVSIVTGDFPETARAIARQAHLGKTINVVLGDELAELADSQILRLVEKGGTIFSRVAPEDKLRIVEIVRHSGQIVAVTGDGINDVPALQRADIGVAMGHSGTDVAKEAAEIVLLDDSFDTLIGAIKQGRLTYQNIRKAARSVLTTNAAELTTVMIGLLALSFFNISPAITTLQILAIDIVALLLPIAALGWDGPLSRLMKEKPRDQHAHIITRQSLAGFIGFGGLAALLGYANYLLFFARNNLSPSFIATDTPLYLQATTLTWLTLILCLYVYIFFERADAHEKFFSPYLTSNRRLLAALGCSLFLIMNLIYNPWINTYFGTAPLGLVDWVLALAAAGLFFAVRLSQRHTRKHSRHAVVKLHAEIHNRS